MRGQIGRTAFQQQIEEVPSEAKLSLVTWQVGAVCLFAADPFSPLRQNCDDDLCEEMYSPETWPWKESLRI